MRPLDPAPKDLGRRRHRLLHAHTNQQVHGTDQTRRPWRGQASSSRWASCWRCWRLSARRFLRRAKPRAVSAGQSVRWDACVRLEVLLCSLNHMDSPSPTAVLPRQSDRACVCAAMGCSIALEADGFTLPPRSSQIPQSTRADQRAPPAEDKRAATRRR